MNYFYKSKYLLFLTYGLVMVFFMKLMVNTLYTGGRWDLNEQIAFGNRVVNNFTSYANGINDLYFPSSPYFPGVGYLSAFFQYMGIDNLYYNNQLMLIIAVVIGIVYFYLLKKITIKLYPSIPPIIITSILILFFTTHFRQYMVYMIEFKPDTILLVFSSIIFLTIEKNKKINILDIGIIALLLFIGTFFKQSFFLIYFLTFLLIIFNTFLTKKEKISILLAYSSIGILALYLIFRVDNLFYFTVEVIGQHSMLDIKTIMYFFAKGFVFNIVFIVALIYFIATKYKTFSIQRAESKYFIFAFLWFIFSAISTAKLGGNIGNIEVGIIVFAPFIIYTLDNVFKRLYTNKVFYQLTIVVFIVISSIYFYGLIKGMVNLIDITQTRQISVKYLNDKFKGKDVFVDGNTYIISKEARLNILTEAETLGHFNNIPNYDMSHIKKALENKKYDLLFFKTKPIYYKDNEIEQIMNFNYIILEDKKMPSYLKNKIFIRKGE